mmetsp:Transcript_8503/g.10753  ORF Transcript_8503/g.10753 Transcript_8503/m.10753 type:complete len:133 (+) Transcript_8503:163-561(+)
MNSIFKSSSVPFMNRCTFEVEAKEACNGKEVENHQHHGALSPTRKRKFARRNFATAAMISNEFQNELQTPHQCENEQSNQETICVKKRRYSRRNSATAAMLMDGLYSISNISDDMYLTKPNEVKFYHIRQAK